MTHTHHIVPKHTWKKLYGSLDGVHNKENLIELSVADHASWHYEQWVYFGYREDWLAWKGLTGEIKDNDIILEKCILGGLQHKGRIKSTEEKQKLSDSWTDERKQQLAELSRDRFTGKPKSPNHVAKIRQRKMTPHQIENNKQIQRSIAKGKSIITPFGTFNTIKGAARELNMNPMTIKYRAINNIQGYKLNG